MTEPNPLFLRRRWVSVALGAALVLLTLLSTSRVWGLRSELEGRVQANLERQLTDQVAGWEDRLLDRVGSWLTSATRAPFEGPQLQSEWRKDEGWFDSLYIWVTRIERRRGGAAEPVRELVFPPPAYRESTEALLRRPCLAEVRARMREPDFDPSLVATEYLEKCAGEDIPVTMVAATEAAALLQSEGLYEGALEALSMSGLPDDKHLKDAVREHIPAIRWVVVRTQRAEILQKLGRTDEAVDLWYTTGLEIAGLDAPEAAPRLSDLEWPIFGKLKRLNRLEEINRLQSMEAQARRRVRTYEEIVDRILPQLDPTGVTGRPRFVYDQYAQPPFLLFYGVSETEIGRGAAVQLDQDMLLEDLFRSLRSLADFLQVTDTAGTVVKGREGPEVAITVPFSRTLSHLRVGLRRDAIEAVVADLGNQWVVPAGITALCLVLGGLALWAQERAATQQEALLARQREFTTRVTHELKTPLAGIRIMAENIELGAFRDPAQLHQMARRITQEADRLTRRVDEILTVSQHRAVPDAEPFDPEEALGEAIEEWAPRFEEAGIVLSFEPDVTDEVKGDRDAVRDAVSCLLDNALKYRDEAADPSRVEVSLIQDGDEAVIRVADNGLGVPLAMRTAIFERFVRVEGDNRGLAGGHGLGLAQVAEIAKAHGGRVYCEDGLEGHGSSFVLRLPVVASPGA